MLCFCRSYDWTGFGIQFALSLWQLVPWVKAFASSSDEQDHEGIILRNNPPHLLTSNFSYFCVVNAVKSSFICAEGTNKERLAAIFI